MTATVADVAQALLGTWPTQVTAWGEDGIAAYLAELSARGLTPDATLIAIRSYDPDADFPPSAAKLAQAARHDPSQPVLSEVIVMLKDVLNQRTHEYRPVWGLGERDKADEQKMLERANELHPLFASFVARQGIGRLRDLDLNDREWGEVNRKRLGDEWAQHVEAMDGRDVARMISGRSAGGLDRVDPLAALNQPRAQIESGAEV